MHINVVKCALSTSIYKSIANMNAVVTLDTVPIEPQPGSVFVTKAPVIQL